VWNLIQVVVMSASAVLFHVYSLCERVLYYIVKNNLLIVKSPTIPRGVHKNKHVSYLHCPKNEHIHFMNDSVRKQLTTMIFGT